MIVDQSFRAKVVSDGVTAFDTYGFTNINSASDRPDSRRLFEYPTVATASIKVCMDFWDINCFLRMMYWDDHDHPVANPKVLWP